MDDADLINKIGRKRYRRRLERDRYYTQAIDPSALTSSPSPPLTAASLTSNMATTAAGNKLAQEIHDEFLTCKICLEGFKSPKCLDCLHTFCEQCIDNHVLNECTYKKYSDYREFTCPLCRKRTQLPIGGVKKLPDNFLVSSLGEVVARQKPSKYPFCDICKLVNRKHREATSKCIDCNKLLCKLCVDMHKETKVTLSHSLFDVEIEKDIECKEHPEESVRFYCEHCQTCICVLCTFNEHKDHEITQFVDAVCKYKENITDLLSNCKGKIDVYDRQIALLNKCETVIKGAEQKIRDSAIQYIADIRNKEKTLIDELHAMYGKELMEYVGRKNEMQNNLDGLKSTTNLTELVLKGKDIELLLLKKQVQEKLTTMAEVELQDLPSSVGKQVEFVQGTMDFGRLEDPNRQVEKHSEKQNERNIENKTDHVKKAGQHSETKNDDRRVSLPNMIFGKHRDRDLDIMDEIAERPSPKTQQSTQSTQTESRTSRLCNRYIQTEFPESFYERRRDDSSNSSSTGRVSMSLESRGTETDVISTNEKAVNTRTRSLMAQQLKSEASRDGSPSTVVESSSGLELSSSPTPRRHRRRRERVKPVEVSARPTTSSSYNQASSEGYDTNTTNVESSTPPYSSSSSTSQQGVSKGIISNTPSPPNFKPKVEEFATVLTYSSSIDDSVYNACEKNGHSGQVFDIVASIDSPVSTVIASFGSDGESDEEDAGRWV